MEFVLHSFFVSLPLAVAVWLIMVVVLAGLAVLLVFPSRLTSRARDRAARRAPTGGFPLGAAGRFMSGMSRRFMPGTSGEFMPGTSGESTPAMAREFTPGTAGVPTPGMAAGLAPGMAAGLAPGMGGGPGPGMAAGPAPTPAEDLRYADEISVAARRAAATAERRRTEWITAQEELDAAWAAFDAADRAARATLKADAFPLMSRRRKPGENVDRQRYLHHAASEACRHREISIKQLNEIFAHRGWNPRLHPVFQEGALRNAIRDHRLAGYRQALANERKAWQAAELSAEAVRSLRLEVAAAIARSGSRQPAPGEQWWAEQWTTADLPAAA